ncbi:M56 family metallopeptidase [Zunongwangia sp. HGR-M22]|uniref:M56 family metallopeptidase n=1 Tax=Zunongwangia sp. HGR-M22 TaxID=3015168 RepID=UPI0022DE3362|nr:M56 family metallopeptidase [Zunongwangia sp. HGR-M22]WBL24363.1 M56 family metallopeptidase [Zunongwangia sp. HGR-M22]
MIIYILKFSGCLLVLYAFYRLFLESEKNHRFKRFYLLFALVASVIIPLITISYQVEAQPVQQTGFLIHEDTTKVSEVKASFWKDQLPAILWTVYSFGVVIFLFRFLGNISRLRRLIQKHEKVDEYWNIKVLLPFQPTPYSYFKYIFVEKDAFEQNNIPKEILKHEEAHVHQKHTLDLLILEILQVIFWFNPLFIFIKKSIRLNHEFLADEAVLKQNISALSYSNLLLNSSFAGHQATMTSSFKHSLIKKRIVMISNSFSKKRVGLKIGFLVPVLCCCIYFFNNAIVAETIQQDASIVSRNSYLFPSVIPTPAPRHFSGSNTGNRKELDSIKNSERIITITVDDAVISFGNVETNLENFVKDFNLFTQNWDEAMLKQTELSLMYYKSNIDIEKLKSEMAKTAYYKKTGKSFLPPPPAPTAPEVIEVLEDVPTPPNSPEIIEVVEDVPNPPAPPKKPEVIEVVENVSTVSKAEDIIAVEEQQPNGKTFQISLSDKKSVKELIKEYNVQLKKLNLLLP